MLWRVSVTVLSTLFPEEFSTQREEWLKSLKLELKVDQVDSKTSKRQLEGGVWSTLSLNTAVSNHLPVTEAWKKAAQTYVNVSSDLVERWIDEDLNAGVRNFFVHKDFLDEDKLDRLVKKLDSFSKKSELVLILVGKKDIKIPHCSFSVMDQSEFVSADFVEKHGGNIIQELAFLARGMIKKEVFNLGVYTDSHFFKNIAKIRAAKLLAKKISDELGSKSPIRVVALTSFRDWTLFERYSNMLRNDAAVASAYIGGADYVQSAGYDSLFEIEIENYKEADEHSDRSRRMARNTSHILALESMLGVVHDAAFGSYHLENLTEHYAKEAWKLMQKIISLSESECQNFLLNEIAPVKNARLDQIKTRKHVLAGVNDFPNAKETLKLKSMPQEKFFRTARCFEELRLKMESVGTKPKVHIAIHGDYAALNARINFVKNYFELLGLEVIEQNFESFATIPKNDFYVLCASDENYEILKDKMPSISGPRFIAGKFELAGFQNLYAGQNVYNVLEGVAREGGVK